jgi:predicted Zn-dependent peptidase
MINEYIGTGANIRKEVLDSGLTVYFLPFNNRSNFYFDYVTKYGALINTFKLDNEKSFKKEPYGIAHFLEHKLFEQEDGHDPFEFFSKYGIDCNASTGYKSTSYYIEGTNNQKEGLDFLIKYVNTPYFTDKNVEKEKGIIIEELNMYMDDPFEKIYRASSECLFKNHEARIDIGGTPNTVKKITKEDLYRCYEAFYRPENMILFIGGNYNYDEVMKVLKDNEKTIEKNSIFDVTIKREIEPYDVNVKYKELNVTGLMIPKLLYTFKQSIDKYNLEDKYSYDFIIKFIIDSAFGETSDFYKDGIKKELFNNFDYGTNIIDNFLLIELAAESKDPKKIIPVIKKYFDELKLTEEDLERYKRVRISREVKKFDYVITGVSTLKGDILDYGDILYNKIDIIKNISLKQVNKVKKEIDFDNVSVVVGNIKSK